MGEGTGRARGDFPLYMASQFLCSLGDAFFAVASAALLVRLTGSGLAAGLGAVFAPLCGLVASSLAGSLGDRFPARRLMAVFGLAKAAAVLGLAAAGALWLRYGMLFLLALAGVLYGIPARKAAALLLPARRLLAGNSALNGLAGAAYFAGPALAGVLVNACSAEAALAVAACCHAASSLFLPFLTARADGAPHSARGSEGLLGRVRAGVQYCRGNKQIARTILAFSALSFGSAATGLAFYPYAFDRLMVTAEEWGVIVSVFNGAMLLSMAFPVFAGKRLGKSFGIPVFLCCLFVADAWFSYGVCGSFRAALPLLAMEGASYFLAATLLSTKLQLCSDPAYMARVLGTNDLAANAARLLGMAMAAAAMALSGVRAVFFGSAALLAVFAAWGIARSGLVKIGGKG